MREAGQDRHTPGVACTPRAGLATEQTRGSPAGPADALDHLVVRIGRDSAGGVALCLPGVGAHAGAACKYRQRLGPDLVQAEPLGEVDGGLRVSITRAQLPAASEGRGELEIQIAPALSAPISSAAG